MLMCGITDKNSYVEREFIALQNHSYLKESHPKFIRLIWSLFLINAIFECK